MTTQQPVESLVETASEELAQLASGYLVVVTGAGISLASGIPTFRGSDPDAVWKNDVTELGTRRYFESDPVGSWRWYTQRFDAVIGKQPNDAHHALVTLESWHVARGGKFLLVTQNVDTLHESAGSVELVKVHGSADRVRCSVNGCMHGAPSGSLLRTDFDIDSFKRSPSEDTLPICPECGAVVRQHVLWFDEYYDEHKSYQWQRVLNASETMDGVLFVGTSFAVGVTDLFLRAALSRRLPAWSIDPAEDRSPHPGIRSLIARGEDLLPQVVERLQAT